MYFLDEQTQRLTVNCKKPRYSIFNGETTGDNFDNPRFPMLKLRQNSI